MHFRWKIWEIKRNMVKVIILYTFCINIFNKKKKLEKRGACRFFDCKHYKGYYNTKYECFPLPKACLHQLLILEKKFIFYLFFGQRPYCSALYSATYSLRSIVIESFYHFDTFHSSGSKGITTIIANIPL